jgi:hypothetical protein
MALVALAAAVLAAMLAGAPYAERMNARAAQYRMKAQIARRSAAAFRSPRPVFLMIDAPGGPVSRAATPAEMRECAAYQAAVADAYAWAAWMPWLGEPELPPAPVLRPGGE